MDRYSLHHFVRHTLWGLILLFLFCTSFNLSLATGIGSVLSLDGDGDEVRVEDAPSLVITNELTIEAWIYPLGEGSGWAHTGREGGIIVNKEGEYELGRFEDGSIRFAVSNRDPGWNWINTEYVVPEGTWAHLAFTYSVHTQIFQLFANGVLVFSSRGIGEIGDVYETHNYFKIGARREEARNFFDGRIDEVRLWDFVRTEADIQATMDTSLQGDEAGLVGYWNFDDGTANDRSDHGNHGILVGDAEIIGNLPRLFFSTTDPINVHDTFTLDLTAEGFTNLAGWELDIAFDPAILNVISVSEGDFLLKSGGQTFFQAGNVNNSVGEITGFAAVRIGVGGVSGTGYLLSITFEGKALGEGNLRLHDVRLGDASGAPISFRFASRLIIVGNSWDVNKDGHINIYDLIVVAQYFGQSDPQADVNGSGIVDIFDLVEVAQRLGESTVGLAPGVGMRHLSGINSETIQNWIDMAHTADDGSLAFQEGIINLEHLLAAIRPDHTALLANYPNPFNPETWIPYQLAHDADVTLTIYDTKGTLVRQFYLGHQQVGYYTDRTRAAYWDGRNHFGESVGSGIYFYQLHAGDYSTTRKMVILK